MAPFVPPPDFNPELDSNYHYVPTGWVCLIFISLYGLSAFVHLVEATYFRMWFLLPTAVLAGIGEVLGWTGRYWSSLNDGILNTPFLIQISTTIIAPTPLLAAYFVMMGRLIDILGPEYSRLSRKQYLFIFTTADVVALIVQAVGGGLASGSQPVLGAHIMLAAIAFQLVFLLTFLTISAEFLIRFHSDRPYKRQVETADSENKESNSSFSVLKSERISRRHRLLLGGMGFSLTCLFIRAVYRTIELSDGWNGRIISTQVYFNVLDGAMVLLAIWTLNVMHPGYLLKKKD